MYYLHYRDSLFYLMNENMMKKKSLALLAGLWLLAAPAQAEVVTIKDTLGRDVKVDVPVKRPILTFYYPDYIAATGVENFNKVVGISREFWEKFNPGSWSLFAEKIPSLKDIADVGYVVSNTFSLEKALALKPDVVVLPEIQFKALASEIAKFEELGIPVVAVDFNDQTVEKHTASVRIFGKLAGTEERAEQLAQEYADGMADIKKRVAEAKQAKPTLYFEFGNKGPSEYSFTYGKNMWGAIAEQVGADNISAPFIENWGQINPEQFLASKPEVIMISGTELGHENNPDIMSMGINITEEDAQKRLAGFLSRAGWENMPAVQNNRVFGLYQSASRSISDLASAQFMAKALYPEAFADVDPVKTYMDFHKNYLPITPTGTFYIQLKK